LQLPLQQLLEMHHQQTAAVEPAVGLYSAVQRVKLC